MNSYSSIGSLVAALRPNRRHFDNPSQHPKAVDQLSNSIIRRRGAETTGFAWKQWRRAGQNTPEKGSEF
jgi:hypothetical protein